MIELLIAITISTAAGYFAGKIHAETNTTTNTYDAHSWEYETMIDELYKQIDDLYEMLETPPHTRKPPDDF